MTIAIAAVAYSNGAALELEAVDVEDPRAGELLIKLVATGLCHTDLVMRDGLLPTPKPVVLGHEGAGIVEKVGDGVAAFKPGDHVVIGFGSCGQCGSCEQGQPAYCHEFFPQNFFGTRRDGSTALTCGGIAVHSHIFGQSSFATHCICTERNAIKVPDDVPLELMGPLGCGFQTGAGTVLNALKVRQGSSILVMGAGPVGLAAIMAAKIAGAATIAVLDKEPTRIDLAMELGATLCVAAGKSSLVDIPSSGFDYCIDTTGRRELLSMAISALKNRGECALIAAYPPGTLLEIDASFLMSGGRVIRGVVEGDSDQVTFIPKLIDYWRRGLFPVEKLIRFYPFAAINQAIADSEAGRVVKAVLKF